MVNNQNHTARTIFITGSSRGFGKALTEYFANKGWNVAATMRNISKGNRFSRYPNVFCIGMDVNDFESINSAVKQTVDQYGRIDLVVNNAAYCGFYLFEEVSDEMFRNQFETNFFGALNVIRAILPVIYAQHSGHIINVTSVAGRLGIPLHSGFCAAKHALTGFSDAIQYELEAYGAKITAFEVGAMTTHFADAVIHGVATQSRARNGNRKNKLRSVETMLDKVLKHAAPPEKVAAKLYRLANKRNPPVFCRPTTDSWIIELLRRVMPSNRLRKLASYSLYRYYLKKY